MPQQRMRPTVDRSADAIARLYVIWIGSTCLTLLVVVLVIFLLRGELSRQNLAIRALAERMESLESRLATSRPTGPARVTPPVTHDPPVAAAQPNSTTTRPTAANPPLVVAPTAPPVVGALNEAAVEQEIGKLLRLGDLGRPEISDKASAMALVARVDKSAAPSQFKPPTLGRLALLALLTGRADRAAAFAQQAESGGQPAVDYLVENARTALDEGRIADARAAASRAYELSPMAECAIIHAAALVADVQYEIAGDVVEGVRDWTTLSPDDCIRLANVFVELEWWPELAKLIPRVTRLPAKLEAERERVKAIDLVQHGNHTEAIAILDLLVQKHKDDQTARNWRAIALLRSGQKDAARRGFAEVIEHAPNNLAANYWLGVMAQRDGNLDEARANWQHCVESAPGYTPAWEGLGLLALNQGDVTIGTERLTKAIETDSRRASAQFLLGLAHAKAGRRGPAADALRAAIARDPQYLDEARASEAVRRLFEPRELEGLRGEPTSQPSRKIHSSR